LPRTSAGDRAREGGRVGLRVASLRAIIVSSLARRETAGQNAWVMDGDINPVDTKHLDLPAMGTLIQGEV
jgi:hypothetical protein